MNHKKKQGTRHMAHDVVIQNVHICTKINSLLLHKSKLCQFTEVGKSSDECSAGDRGR